MEVSKKRLTTLAVASVAMGFATVPAARPNDVSRCPIPTSIRDGGSIAEVIRAARRLIPSAFNASTPGNGWARYPVIHTAASLTPLKPDLPGVATLRRMAARRCGSATAARSWALTIDFPGRKVAGEPPIPIFVTLTARGWRLW